MTKGRLKVPNLGVVVPVLLSRDRVSVSRLTPTSGGSVPAMRGDERVGVKVDVLVAHRPDCLSITSIAAVKKPSLVLREDLTGWFDFCT